MNSCMPKTGQPRWHGQISGNIQPTKTESGRNRQSEQTNQQQWTWICKLKTPSKGKSRTRWVHSGILPNTVRKADIYPSQSIPKNWGGENTLKLILWGHHYPDTKTRQRCNQKKKITGQYMINRCKSPQQNISKLNSTIYKKCHTLWSNEIYSRDAKMVQYTQINQCETPY